MNLLHVPATDVYKYAEALLSRLFTKEELASCLVFPSERSSKPGLPGDRVRRFFCELHQLCLEMGRHIEEEEKVCPKIMYRHYMCWK